ncbi:MAG TPA: methyltransferase domain-containing protein [Reyranellaceae bacterium]|nr:methyltransferase domain-containing protein [Reyranellaceae bacterium]
MATASDSTFVGSIPELYDRHLGPVLFEPYAQETARRLGDLKSGALIETAAGTGVVTAALARALPAVDILATDLNQAMLDHAGRKPELKRVRRQQADALALPVADSSFDALVCQFGIMFFPDRVKGYREAHRVLKPGGRAVIAIWDSFEHNNPVARCVTEALAKLFPADPPRFLARTPHGHSDRATIERELEEAGFSRIAIDVVKLSCGGTHRDPAIGFCQGSPLRAEIEARGPGRLAEVTETVAEAVAREFGSGPLEAPMQALMVTATK